MKSPTTEKAPEAPKTEEPAKTEETPAVSAPAPAEPATEAPKEEPKEEKKEEEATPTTPDHKKRGSIFGKVQGLYRNASKAGKSKKEKEATSTPAKVEETPEPKEEKTETPAAEEKKEETPAAPAAAPAEQNAIGDVVPDAVTVGQAPKSTPQVATSA